MSVAWLMADVYLAFALIVVTAAGPALEVKPLLHTEQLTSSPRH